MPPINSPQVPAVDGRFDHFRCFMAEIYRYILWLSESGF